MRTTWSITLLALAAACTEGTIAGPAAPSATAILSGARAPNDNADDVLGGVFTQTNDATDNAVVAYARHADGTLTLIGNFPTGGQGLGGAGATDPLASQYAVVLTPNEKMLFAVNAKSNTIAAFGVRKNGLVSIGTFASNGVRPVSLAATDRVLYVLNQGSNTVTGFRIEESRLAYDSRLTRALSPNAQGGAAIRFTRDAHLLAVTERLSNTIDLFRVEHGELSQAPVQTVSHGAGPFGFDWTPRRDLIVSEAAGGSVSSYRADREGDLTIDTPSLSTQQKAPCWLIVTREGHFAYAANAGSGSVTGYRVDAEGSLHILNTDGMTGILGAGTTPLDLDVSRDSKFLYVLRAGSGGIGGFAIGNDGGLTNLPDAAGGPTGHIGQMGVAAY